MAFLWMGENHRSYLPRLQAWDLRKAPLSSRLRRHKRPSPLINDYLDQAGFLEISQLDGYKMDLHLLTALVERWRPETHTFHLPTGECTITLEDVYMLLGLPYGGRVVTGKPYIEWEECSDLLGLEIPLEHTKSYQLSLTFLTENLNYGLTNDSPVEYKIKCTRRYILWLIGAFLFPNSSGMFVHNCWLPLLVNFEETKTYSWGSAVLATLYRGMCEAARYDKKGLCGCNFLLQVWAFCRMEHIAPIPNPDNNDNNQVQFPLGNKWTGKGSNYYYNPSHDTIHYRTEFDRLVQGHFEWRPYREFRHRQPRDFWDCTASTYLICFDKVEWHPANRVKLQFGLPQDIPEPPVDMRIYHKLDKRFKKFYEDIESKFPEACAHWNSRRAYTLPRVQRRTQFPSDEYINWYTTVCNPNLRIDYHDDHPQEVAEQEFDVESEPEFVSDPEPENNNNIPPSPSFFSGLDQRFTDPSNYQTTTDPTTLAPQTSDFAFLDLNTPLHQIIAPPPYTTPRDHYPPSIGSSYTNDYMSTYAYNDLNQPGTSYTNNPQANNQNFNNQMYSNPHYNYPPTPTDLYPQFTPGPEFNFSISPANDVEFGQSSLGRLSLNSIEDNQFLNTTWPSREDDVLLTLGQSSQVHNDETDDQPIHRQRSRRQIIPPAPTRHNAARNAGAPWCGTGPRPPNARRRNN